MYQNQKNWEKKRRQTRKVTEYGKKKNKKVQSEISHVKRLFDYCKNQKCRKKTCSEFDKEMMKHLTTKFNYNTIDVNTFLTQKLFES